MKAPILQVDAQTGNTPAALSCRKAAAELAEPGWMPAVHTNIQQDLGALQTVWPSDNAAQDSNSMAVCGPSAAWTGGRDGSIVR